MATSKSGALDAMVGARIRMLRVDRGISQTALAARIGVTFQQVQKYEQGAGRVGASRLARIASALDVSVGEFFEASKAGASKAAPFKTAPFEAGPLSAGPLGARSSGPASEATVAHLNTVDLSRRRKCPSQG